MLASLAWLKELCPTDVDGATVASALTSRGLTVDSVDARAGDTVLEIDVPANRPDCLGHWGLARELAAAFGVTARERETAPFPDGEDAVADALTVEIADPDLCPRYTGRVVREVTVAPSPDWLVRRLQACGMRSVNNVVDISNLVLLESGNPIHFFDLDRIAGSCIRIRRAESGEKMTTLDGVERRLDGDMLVIADGDEAVALAGVIGGADSEIRETTRDVLIEAAAFAPLSVRRTARKLGIQTDASHRFERGADPDGVRLAQRLAVHWLETLAGGRAVEGCIDAHPNPYRPAELDLRAGQIQRLLGYRPDSGSVTDALGALGLAPRVRGDDGWTVQVPSWRVDLTREADLVEEVARHLGYDRIPTHEVSGDVAGGSHGIEEPVRELLARLGLHEAFGYAMIGRDEDVPFVTSDSPAPILLKNPIADWLAQLRRTILPGLVRAVELNHRRGVHDVRLFEVGHVFLARDGKPPHEPAHLGLAWSGRAIPEHWSGESRPVDLYDVMGLVERVLRCLDPDGSWARERLERPALHPGQSIRWQRQGGDTVAIAGRIHPGHAGETQVPVFLAEIDLSAVTATDVAPAQFSALPRLTEVNRDLAVVLPATVSYGSVEAVLASQGAPAPVRFAAVDRYAGPPLAAGEASVTVRLTLSPSERTLKDEEIDEYRLRVVAALESELGLKIRG